MKTGDLKKIQKRIKKDYKLALDLYKTGNYDAMYLAGLITDDERMTKMDLKRWVTKAYAGALSGYTVPWVAAGSQHDTVNGIGADRFLNIHANGSSRPKNAWPTPAGQH